MKYETMSDVSLLRILVGTVEAERALKGAFASLIRDAGADTPLGRKLAAALELHRRAIVDSMRRGDVLSDPSVVKRYLQATLAGKPVEVFQVLFLDSQNRLIATEEMARGTINSASVYPREVLKRVIHHHAAAVIFAHNHPSGVAEPSEHDRQLTDRLRQALALVDVRVVDHLVTADPGEVVSFAERGWV